MLDYLDFFEDLRKIHQMDLEEIGSQMQAPEQVVASKDGRSLCQRSSALRNLQWTGRNGSRTSQMSPNESK